MKKIFLLALMLIGFNAFAQTPLYIYNYASVPAVIMVSATGSENGNCDQMIMTEFYLASGASIVLNDFSDSLSNYWVQGGTSNSYTNAQAAANYGVARWQFVRFDIRFGGTCGAGVGNVNDCYHNEAYDYSVYIPCLECGCAVYGKWEETSAYVSVTFYE